MRGALGWFYPAGVPLAWRQLCHDRNRLIATVLGIVFAVTSILFTIGTYNALFESVVTTYHALNADLIVRDAAHQSITLHTPFSRDHLIALLRDPEVESVEGISTLVTGWKAEDGSMHELLVIAIDPNGQAFQAPDIRQNMKWLKIPDSILFDKYSLPEFGEVEGRLEAGDAVTGEINGRRCYFRGVFGMGISFAATGQAIMSREGYNRVFSDQPDYGISLGLIRLRPGANKEAVMARLQARLPNTLKVTTKEELMAAEKRYWNERTPIGFIIPMTLLVVVIVGAVIFYQILYTDVQHHLPEYATLKAIGFHSKDLERVVLQQSILLSLLGFPAGALISWGLFTVANNATHLPFELSFGQTALAFLLTFLMCLVAGFLAMRTLNQAQPAEVFS